ncbi:PREDICTED: WD repeat-containing protein KIAA1875 homolog [Chrysochloris asiatica]|uniref:WD repeat-containing protein KIAA1875 homolog n=1 Tax=Chrysochloris asiatica TaxID=185453 RepID=A0A9B0WDC4_CHRAS|nr:PREDICTED: WD repeat-containing protein KIAA1875 homolog [Chrysochloris asiatica]
MLKEDFEVLATRDQDLQRLRLGLVVPTARPPPSLKQRQEAFDNYLHLIYGPSLVGEPTGGVLQQWRGMAFTVERETWDTSALPTAVTSLQKGQAVPVAVAPKDLRSLGQHLVRPPQVALPILPTSRKVHSRASELLSQSSLSCTLGLSLDLQLPSERFWKGTRASLDPVSPDLPETIPLKRHPKLLSNLTGFFPATIKSPNQYCRQPGLRPIPFPGFVPNSVVLQHLWLPTEMGGLGSLALLTPHQDRPKPSDESRRHLATWQQTLLRWLGRKSCEELDNEEEKELDWASTSTLTSLRSEEELQPLALESEVLSSEMQGRSYADDSSEMEEPSGIHRSLHWEERYAHLPRFLQDFVSQNWFKKLFPIFTLEAYPEMSTVEGLASLLVDMLEEASWGDGVDILTALMTLLPDVSDDLRSRLRGSLVRLLNLDPPPSLQDFTQKQFVLLALQLLLACSLESRDVVLELMSYSLYSPADCQPELKKLLSALGLQDPMGILFKKMMTWAQGSELNSKALLRSRCSQKLEDMMQNLQMELRQFAAKFPDKLPNASEPWKLVLPKMSLPQASQPVRPAPHIVWMPSHDSEMSSSTGETLSPTPEVHLLEPSSAGLDLDAQESESELTQAQLCAWRTRRSLSVSLQAFACSSGSVTPQGQLTPLEQTEWSRLQLLDLVSIDALNYFCEQQLGQNDILLSEETEPQPPSSHMPNTVVRQPLNRKYQPILRLQETRIQTARVNLKGRKLPRLHAGGPLRLLKLPLPRVEPQPFPPDWPRPARPLPPLLLQATLQRYFLPEEAKP